MKNANIVRHWGDLPEGYTISENDVGIDLLFHRLINYGVWDKKRGAMLMPLIDRIKRIWRVLAERPDLFRVVTCQNGDGSKWAHHIIVKVTTNGVLLQGLMANCHEAPTPMETFVLNECRNSAVQTWYLPATGNEKPGFSERMMGMKPMERIRRDVPGELCDTVEHQYMFARPVSDTGSGQGTAVVPVTDANYAEFLEFVRHHAGEIVIRNEGFDGGDPYLEELDEEFRSIDLFRRRNMYLGYIKGKSTPAAALVCYDGPLGMNLRFLERKSDLYMSEDLTTMQLTDLCGEIIRTASVHYEQGEPGFIPIVTGEFAAQGLRQHGAELHTVYHQHMTVPENGMLVDYHLNLLRLRYEKMKELMQAS